MCVFLCLCLFVVYVSVLLGGILKMNVGGCLSAMYKHIVITEIVVEGHQKTFENCCDDLARSPDRISYCQTPVFVRDVVAVAVAATGFVHEWREEFFDLFYKRFCLFVWGFVHLAAEEVCKMELRLLNNMGFFFKNN